MSNDSDRSFLIQLNGEPYSIQHDMNLVALIQRLNLRRGRVAIELNQSVIPKAEWANISLQAGDRVEIVNFVGGG
jgi:thiamine biosynthesis protein ThiS